MTGALHYKNTNFSYPKVTDEKVLLVDASAESKTITLPPAQEVLQVCFVVKKTDTSSNSVTINTSESQTIDGTSSYVLNGGSRSEVKLWSDGTEWHILSTPGVSDTDGFLVDYNDSTTASSPISLTADTWTTITNDGAGAFTNLQFLPSSITRLLDTSTGEIDPTELNLGSSLLIRNDFTVTPQVNNSSLEFQYTLGAGEGAYTLGLALGRLDRGAGVGYRFSMRVDKIYMGDTNTRDNPIGLQVKCSSDATLVNAGISITVVNN